MTDEDGANTPSSFRLHSCLSLGAVLHTSTHMHAGVAHLADKVLSGELLDRDEAAFLTRVGGEDVYDLFYWANKIRVRFVGPEVRFCAIVAAKVGGCSEDCKFCAQSEHH